MSSPITAQTFPTTPRTANHWPGPDPINSWNLILPILIIRPPMDFTNRVGYLQQYAFLIFAINLEPVAHTGVPVPDASKCPSVPLWFSIWPLFVF